MTVNHRDVSAGTSTKGWVSWKEGYWFIPKSTTPRERSTTLSSSIHLSLSLIFEWKTCYTEDLWRYPSSHQWITFALRFEGEVPSPTTLLRARTDSEELKSFTILEDCGVWSIPRSYSISDGLIKFSVEFTVKTFVHTHNEANFGLIWSLVVGLVIKCYLLSCYFSYIWYLL